MVNFNASIKIKSVFASKYRSAVHVANRLLTQNLHQKKLILDGSEQTHHFISFVFDDFPESAAVNGSAILNECNLLGTFYVSLNRLDTIMYGKKICSAEKVMNVHEQGHEIGCHTYYHTDCREVSRSEITETIERNARAISDLIPGYVFRSFGYPQGQYNYITKMCVNRVYNTGRTTKSGMNHGMIDLNLLKANQLYSNKIPVKHCKDLIDRNRILKSWLIFYTHDVEINPSRFGCTPEYFKEVVTYAVRSGAAILPVNDVYEMLVSKN